MTEVWNLVFHIFHINGSEGGRSAVLSAWGMSTKGCWGHHFMDMMTGQRKRKCDRHKQPLGTHIKEHFRSPEKTVWERLHVERGGLCPAVLLCLSFLGFWGPHGPHMVTLRPRAAWALRGLQYCGLAHLCPMWTSPYWPFRQPMCTGQQRPAP